MLDLIPRSHTRRLLENFNWSLLGVVVVICSIGVYNLASASRAAHAQVWVSQAWWMGIGVILIAALCTFDYRHLLGAAYPLYVLTLVFLVLVLFVGSVHKGAQRWLVLGPMRFQPSELAKIAVVIALARFYHDDKEPTRGYTLVEMWKPLLLLLLPVALIIRQPDLGTSLLVLAIGGTLILFARVEKVTLTVILATVALGVVAFWVLFELFDTEWMWFLEDYQRQRVLTFLRPEGDELGAGYHANQSIIAIGSGGLGGKGWGEGTQTQLSFLPEQHTDFVFSVWAEEHGFMGSLALLGLYGVLLALAIGVAASAKERFGVFLSIGAAAILFWQVFVNIGMVTGVLPVVGVTLPLLSYGGSSVVTTLAAVGLLLNVSMRRFIF